VSAAQPRAAVRHLPDEPINDNSKGLPMTDLVPYTGNLLPSRIERQANRAVAKVQARQAVATAREVGRVAAVAEVAESAMLAVSHVSALESLLVTRTPRAEERLRHIADAAALNLTEVVLSTNRGSR
jgi:hypothetical protein